MGIYYIRGVSEFFVNKNDNIESNVIISDYITAISEASNAYLLTDLNGSSHYINKDDFDIFYECLTDEICQSKPVEVELMDSDKVTNICTYKYCEKIYCSDMDVFFSNFEKNENHIFTVTGMIDSRIPLDATVTGSMTQGNPVEETKDSDADGNSDLPTSYKTIARTVALLIMVIINILNALGLSEYINFDVDNDKIYNFIISIITVIVAINCWWKNNSFTSSAKKADLILNLLKNQKSSE